MAKEAAKPIAEVKRPRQGRSPAYPGIDLKKAMEQAKALHTAEGKYAVPMPSAFAAWGYGIKSSGGRETRAALKYYGLIVVEGDNETGKVKLTDKALRALLDEREDQTEKKALIREFATTPTIHQRLMEQFPDGLKSDATVRHFLMFDEGYNEKGASEIISEFKVTAAYAGLYEPDNIMDKVAEGDPKAEDNLDPPPAPPPPPATQKGQQVKTVAGERELTTGMLSKDASFRLIVSGAVGVKEIERLIKKLMLDKEILAEPSDGEATN